MSARPILAHDELLIALQGIIERLDRIEARLGGSVAGGGKSAVVTDLLNVIVLFSEGREFSAWEIVDRASLPDAVALRAAITAACGSVSARRVGKLLKRCEGAGTGYHVRRVAVDRDGIVWSVASLRV